MCAETAISIINTANESISRAVFTCFVIRTASHPFLFLLVVDIIQDLLPIAHIVNETVDAVRHLLRIHMAVPEMKSWSIPHGLLRMIPQPVIPGKEQIALPLKRGMVNDISDFGAHRDMPISQKGHSFRQTPNYL